jgi:tRNA threonylcarbamoyladenosine biosynthesis protein TsaE
MATTVTILSLSEAETAAVGRDLAASLHAGSAVLLFGDLGAGKTAFVRGLAAGLGIDQDVVTSPTFTLIHTYHGGRLSLVHADLYRLNDGQEIEDLGLEEIGAEGVLAVEWAEKLPRPPAQAVAVRITHGHGDERRIAIERLEA